MEGNRTVNIKHLLTAFISLILISSSVEAQKKGPVFWNTEFLSSANYQDNIIREANQAVKILKFPTLKQ